MQELQALQRGRNTRGGGKGQGTKDTQASILVEGAQTEGNLGATESPGSVHETERGGGGGGGGEVGGTGMCGRSILGARPVLCRSI